MQTEIDPEDLTNEEVIFVANYFGIPPVSNLESYGITSEYIDPVLNLKRDFDKDPEILEAAENIEKELMTYGYADEAFLNYSNSNIPFVDFLLNYDCKNNGYTFAEKYILTNEDLVLSFLLKGKACVEFPIEINLHGDEAKFEDSDISKYCEHEKFIILPLSLYIYEDNENFDKHLAFLLIDNDKKEIEYFDSQGPAYWVLPTEKFLKKWIRTEFKGYKFIPTIKTCIQIGPFCGIYGALYIIIRIENPDLDRNKIFNFLESGGNGIVFLIYQLTCYLFQVTLDIGIFNVIDRYEKIMDLDNLTDTDIKKANRMYLSLDLNGLRDLYFKVKADSPQT